MISTIICCEPVSNGFSICISNDFNVYLFGKSTFIHENKDHFNSPTQINNLTNIKMIACGNSHIICLNYNGEVLSFGNNMKKEN